MNFDFSEDQKQLKHVVNRLLADNCAVSVVRSAMEKDDGVDWALWETMAGIGLMGTNIPEAYGGSGFGYLELCVVAEEFGRALAPVPFASSVYQFAEYLVQGGTETQKSDLLPQVAAGQLVGTVVLDGGRGHGGAPMSFANGRLSGASPIVVDGGCASWAIVRALDTRSDQDGLFLVNLTAPGVTRTQVQLFDRMHKGVRLELSSAEAEPLAVSGLLDHVRDATAVLLAFEQVGGAERCIDMATDYTRQRFAFGRPVGSFQAIKHMLANMFITATLARSNAYYGAWALATDSDELPVAAATARVSATYAFQECAMNNIQAHGGIGFTWDIDCHLYYRRSNFLAIALGGLSDWEIALVDRLSARPHSI
ncbi:acyl-CoA dehydrogenase family protein [Microbaculum marinisediminis]|uniref:Acyl-CoA/acyl-ACP dehydrogenase n=1 Tax=Microbaculum marinisediminis TaxID=2931392 RepID=A0AAW5R484_9HYPH|nr:acyl-CoA dehydrogenase family protein [Microbaculum sp. A6E488]MCT8973688.1 acyl-CoA/acyl-ACP dehydrogenase [Microbaculum sp. A6E488]